MILSEVRQYTYIKSSGTNYAVGIHMLALTRGTSRKGDVKKNVMPRITSSARDTLKVITVVECFAIAFVVVVVRVGPTVGLQAIELITSLKGIIFAPPGGNTLTHPVKSTSRAGITTSAALDGGRCGTVDNAFIVATKIIAIIRTTRVQGKSQKEREAHNDDDWTVAFLRLPFLILGCGGGSAIECSVLHNDIAVDE